VYPHHCYSHVSVISEMVRPNGFLQFYVSTVHRSKESFPVVVGMWERGIQARYEGMYFVNRVKGGCYSLLV
jgi:hypothetical protein